ncbi:MAG: hypothetical protein ABI543_15265 [Ignavibacteria bacterium]
MKKYIKNITSIFIAFILLSGGNFAFAISHGDCIFVNHGYITCEMECCDEVPCEDEAQSGIVVIKDDSKSCCEVHLEQSMEQDITMPVIAKKQDLSKTLIINLSPAAVFFQSTGIMPVIHKFKTSNILLFTSILRI